jgi:hypothetical protein
MADSNAPEHQDRGLFGLFGKKKEEETHGGPVEGHVAGVAPYEQGHVGEAQPKPVSHGHVGDEPHPVYGHVEEAHLTPVSHGHVGVGEPHPTFGHIGETQPAPVSHGHVGEAHPAPVYGHVGEAHPVPLSHGHVGEVHPVPVSHGHGHVEEGKLHGEGEEKKHEGGLTGKLHRNNSSSSSSSSDEEVDENGEKKKKKGGLRDKLKLHGRKKEEEQGHVKFEQEGGEKKGLMEKIKEKLPGHHKEEVKE